MSKQILNTCSNFQQTIFHTCSTVVIHIQVYICFFFGGGEFKAAQSVNKYETQRFFPMLTSLHFFNILSKINPALPLACLLKINLNTIFSFTPTFPKPFPWDFPTNMSWCMIQACLMKSTKRYYRRWHRPFLLLSIACLFILLSGKHNYINIV